MAKANESPTLRQHLVRIVIGVTGLAGIALGLGVAFLFARSWGRVSAQDYCESVSIGFGLLTLCVGLLMVAYVVMRRDSWHARLHVPLVLLLLLWANVFVLLELLLRRRDYATGAAIYSELLSFDNRLLIVAIVVPYLLGSIMLMLRHSVLQWSQESLRMLVIGMVASLAFLVTMGIVIGYRDELLIVDFFRDRSADLPELTSTVLAAYSTPYVLMLVGAILFGLVIAVHPLYRHKRGSKRYKLTCERLAVVSFVVGLGFSLSVLGLWSPLFKLCAQELCQPEGRYTRLHAAAMLGRVDSVRRLLGTGMEVDAWDDHNQTPLMSALAGLGARESRMRRGDGSEDGPYNRAHHQEVLELLLSRGASVDAVTDDGWIPLHFAASTGSESVVVMLLANAIDVDARDTKGRTPLHVAARDGDVVAAKVLLAHGATANIQDSDGNSPLHDAVTWSRYHDSKDELARGKALINVLLSAGAQPELTNAAGQAPAELTAPEYTWLAKLLDKAKEAR